MSSIAARKSSCSSESSSIKRINFSTIRKFRLTKKNTRGQECEDVVCMEMQPGRG
jgi:hypothetical protein